MSLPPCVVCGRYAFDSRHGFPSTFDEDQATEVLGHPPPEALSVFDEGVRKRFWVGHADCTGFSLRTPERSAEELRDRLRRYEQRRQAADAPHPRDPRGVVRTGMSRDQVRRLLGPPHRRDTGTGDQLIVAGRFAALLIDPSEEESWLYRGMPAGRRTRITFRDGRVVDVRTSRENT
ncbi:Protein of unknown function [Lentzea xinjiangensis]|uniref:Uncharacterized protein n=1 Tax=Lentzea xinjiangensis TaxID=402600 RepID=A0A1H9DBW8_9PSEU|nr:DUF2845 domain-containing protein [Lentzea xinjiangensis]SEQ10964.1 Protein of unknown function [Lentzea xinjiangensis]